MDYSIKIDAFEGPLDLLLHLIKESNIDIYDISIDVITRQYLDYINKMEELNINIASSYLVMAAELMELKSKGLLPSKNGKDSENEDDYEENTRENLIQRLLEYQKYKVVTEKFRNLEEDRKKIFIKGPERKDNYLDSGETSLANGDVLELYEAFLKFLERKRQEKPLNTKITKKEYSVEERKEAIYRRVSGEGRVCFDSLFEVFNKGYVVVTFLAILEMSKEQKINIIQDGNFADIFVEMREGG